MALHKAELERRLRESEEHFAATLASIGNAVIAADRDGMVMFMNPVAESLTRWRSDEAAGLPLEQVFRIVDPRTRMARRSPALRALLEDRIVKRSEPTLLIARDLAEIPIDDSAAPIRTTKFGVAGVVLVFRDITEKQQAAAALRMVEEKSLDRALRHAESQQKLFLETITAMARAVEYRDEYTGNHTQRVTDYALMLADELNLSALEKDTIRLGAPVHDIGKIAIPDEILRKPGRLDCTSLRNARRVLDHFTKLGVARTRVKVVISHSGQPSELPIEEAEDALGEKLSRFVPYDPTTVNAANNSGVPEVVKSPKSKMSNAIREMAKINFEATTSTSGLLPTLKQLCEAIG